MSNRYSQTKAMLAITKASIRAQSRSPMALVFSFFFPLFFIVIFGSSNGGGPVVRIALAPNADTANYIVQALHQVPIIVFVSKDKKSIEQDLSRGRITAIVDIRKNIPDSFPAYTVAVQSSTAAVDRIRLFESVLKMVVAQIDSRMFADRKSVASVNMMPLVQGRIYRSIDFILPGQLGFSLLSAGLFGLSFLFFNLRETLVLKRLNATPIRRPFILFGETIARIVFQMAIIAIILLIGTFVFNFTLVHGWITFVELMFLSLIGLLVFMGFGYFISGFAKNINSIPVLTNLLGFPQFMLSGTFFPIESLPHWLQPLCRILPLTHLNTAMRNIAFEGAHLQDCGTQLLVLLLWGIAVYAIAIKVFKWE
ncbi:MAG TPA: ABC transporter permease [Flavitalea sp.]|nr:ABC transporter permease [Flavitalea sp.]